MRVSVALALCCLGTLSFAADPAHASIRKTTDIPAEELGSALQTLAKDYDFQVLYRTEIVKDLRTQGAAGTLTSDEALGKVLKGTGLSYKYLDANTVTVYPASSAPSGASAAAGSDSQSQSASKSSSSKEGQNTSNSFRVAQVDQGKNAGTAAVGNQTSNQENSNGQSAGLAEIVVTAQKRSERLQDVPIPVTVIAAQSLIDSNQLRLQDYYTSVPGLSMTSNDYGGGQLAIRGLTTGANTSPTVGVLIDDVPYGSSTGLASGAQVPDFDPSDLERVEVLRGPQGTLYGASSLGGLLKYMTVDPSTEAVSGRVQAGTSSVYNGSELGYNFRASVNVPISNDLAIRASGFTREDPGYIDNPLFGLKGINEEKVYGGRLSGLWRPSDIFSLKLSALVEHTDRNGSPDVDAGLGGLQQEQLLGTGSFVNNVQAYSATANLTLGSATLTALSGYNVNTVHRSLDFTSDFGSTTEFFFPGTKGTEVLDNPSTRRFTQELRLSMPLGSRIDWLVGAFYNHEDSSGTSETLLAINPASGSTVGTVAYIVYPSIYAEIAGFTDLTVRLTDRLSLQVGARESGNRQFYQQNAFGPLAGGVEFVGPVLRSKDNAFTYLATPSFKISDALMVYARLASGYRPGGPNFNTVLPGIPETYNHDTTENYELGAKGDFLQHRLLIDASLYYIKWKDIQLQLFSAGTGEDYFANAGTAKSQGVELSIQGKPFTGLTVAGWAAWNDAELTQDFPAGSTALGSSGNRLPDTARFSGNLSIQQDFPIAASLKGFIRGEESYVGERIGIFGTTTTPQRQTFPAYAKTNLGAGAIYGDWTFNLFLNNATDRRGLIGGGLGTFNPIAYQYIQPRTVGFSIAKTF